MPRRLAKERAADLATGGSLTEIIGDRRAPTADAALARRPASVNRRAMEFLSTGIVGRAAWSNMKVDLKPAPLAPGFFVSGPTTLALARRLREFGPNQNCKLHRRRGDERASRTAQ